MEQLTYTKLINTTVELYLDEKYEEAYNFITENYPELKCNEAQVYNFRYCTACKAGNVELAMKLLREAVNEKGYWYTYEYLMQDEDLIPLRDFLDFEELAKICADREKTEKLSALPQLKIIEGIGNSTHARVVMALHGNEENVELTEDYWIGLAANGITVALPQSSQIGFTNAYFWDDLETSTSELEQHVQKVFENEKELSKHPFIIGGFSAGARAVLHALLTEAVTADGFILVAPWLPDLSEWEPMIGKLKGMKGLILCGQEDEDCLDGARRLQELLVENKIEHGFNWIPGLQHDYPEDFKDELEHAIKEIWG